MSEAVPVEQGQDGTGARESSLPRYVAGRLLWAVPVVLGLATLVFLVVQLAPGGPCPPTPGSTRATIEQCRLNLGLDRPLLVQYGYWLRAVASGDLGWSTSHAASVSSLLWATLPNTVLLSGSALSISFVLGTLIGSAQAVRPNTTVDRIVSVVLLACYSMPSFWLAVMLLAIMTPTGLFPVSGMFGVDYVDLPPLEQAWSRLRYLTLPTVALSLGLTAGIARYVRGSMLEILRQDCVRTARAKGLPESVVVLKHALRNALAPVITLVGMYLPVVLGGTVVIESIFAWPGMGRLMLDAIGTRDYPLVVAGASVFALAVVLANLLADVLYAMADPRVRYRRAE